MVTIGMQLSRKLGEARVRMQKAREEWCDDPTPEAFAKYNKALELMINREMEAEQGKSLPHLYRK
jgi:hypothetical protein